MTTQPPADGRSPGDTPLSDPAVRERLYELPPSAKLVARVLFEEGSLTKGAIAERTLLPDRTARYGLTALEDAGLVEARPSLQDPRKRVYLFQTEFDE